MRKKNKRISDIILAIWMFFIGLHLFSAYGMFRQWHLTYPVLIFSFAPFPLVHGPFLFLNVLSLIRDRQKLRGVDLLHFLPLSAMKIV